MKPYYSILIPTYKRSESLAQVLDLLILRAKTDKNWEILIADNASELAVEQLCNQYSEQLPIKYHTEPRKGKTNALNSLLSHAKGDILVFMDDDILLDCNLFSVINDAINNWPNHCVFGSNISPKLPEGITTPAFINNSQCQVFLAVSEPSLDEGECLPNEIFGGCWFIKRHFIDQGYRFDENIGPKGRYYKRGSETSFVMKLNQAGYHPIHLPRLRVFHLIREEQLKPSWFFERAYCSGMTYAYYDKSEWRKMAHLFGFPRFYLKLFFLQFISFFISIFLFNKPKYVKSGIAFFETLGKLREFKNDLSSNEHT
jgi:glycosyltransferase involved in cell wall biosynthesis